MPASQERYAPAVIPDRSFRRKALFLKWVKIKRLGGETARHGLRLSGRSDLRPGTTGSERGSGGRDGGGGVGRGGGLLGWLGGVGRGGGRSLRSAMMPPNRCEHTHPMAVMHSNTTY